MKIMYWCSEPGNFVRKFKGTKVDGASFTGTVKEWYETLVETMIDFNNYDFSENKRNLDYFKMRKEIFEKFLESSVLFKFKDLMSGALINLKVEFDETLDADTIVGCSDKEIYGVIRVLGY